MGSEGKKISHEKKKKPYVEIHEMRISNFQTDTFSKKGSKSLFGFFLKNEIFGGVIQGVPTKMAQK